MEKIYANTVNTACRDHVMHMDKDIQDALKLNSEIKKLIYERTSIHKMSMVREFLFKSIHAITRDVRSTNLFRDYGSTHPHVDECIEDMVRSAQNTMYNLYRSFDNYTFLDEYMFEDKGHALESYYDPESKVNILRSVVDDKVDEFLSALLLDMEQMKLRANKMNRKEFILCPFHTNYCNERTQKEAKDKLEMYKKR